ncbi:MAG: pteridine reductase [Gammaproteobacteria bacterium]
MTKCVLITGSAKRIGARIARELHAAGYRLIIHFRESSEAAQALKDELNERRPQSVELLQADLLDIGGLPDLANRAVSLFGRIDGLVNNASAFYRTPLESLSEAQWDEFFGCNLKAPFFLCLALARELEARRGAIVNVSDIHGLRPMKGFSPYSISKAAMNAMTLSLARELAPSVRVNAVAPGAILWPESPMSTTNQAEILARIPLQRCGSPGDIGQAVLFLLQNDYCSGQILAIDGGRSIFS